MRSNYFLTPLTLALFAAAIPAAHAADVLKADNTDALNLDTSWVGGTAPASTDIAVWDVTVTAARNTALGADTAWAGIKLSGAVGLQTISNVSSANTLTLGASGIDFTGAADNSALSIQSKVTLTASQTWNVINSFTGNNPATLNQSEDLSFIAQASGTAFDLGGNTITKTGDGTVAFSSGYNLTNGTIALNEGILVLQSGGSRNIASDVTINAASGTTLRFQANSNSTPASAVVSTGTLTLSGSTLELIHNTSASGTTIDLQGGLVLAADSTVRLRTTITGSGGQNNPTLISGVISGTGKLTIERTTGSHELTLSGTNTHTGGTQINSGIVHVQGNQSAANGGWSIAPGSAGATVNFASGSTIVVGADRAFQVGNLAASGTGTNTLNVAGSVTSASAFHAARGSVVNLNSGGAWTQNADLSIAAKGGYNATFNVNSGATLTHNGPSGILIDGTGTSGPGTSTLNIAGGTVETSQGFILNGTTTATGGLPVASVVLSNGGTIRLSNNVALLTSGTAVGTASGQFEIGTGGGTIDTNGYDTSVETLTGTGALTLTGGGSFDLLGDASAFTGNYVIDGANFTVSGTTGSTSAINVSNTGGLAGTGVVGGAVNIGTNSVLAAGDQSIGTLYFQNSVTLSSTASFILEIDTDNNLFDALNFLGVSNDLTFTENATLHIVNIGGGSLLGEYDVILGANIIGLEGLNIVIDPAYTGELGTDGKLTITAIPEPSAYALVLAAGAVGVLALRRRRR